MKHGTRSHYSWGKLATHVMELQLNPVEAINLLFEQNPSVHAPPETVHLTSSRYFEALRYLRRANDVRCADSFRLMKNLYDEERKCGRASASILADPTAYYNPAFRLFMASENGHTELAMSLLDPVAHYFWENPAQCRFYKNLGMESIIPREECRQWGPQL